MATILIVDDNKNNRLILKLIISEDSSHKILEAENGEEAVAICKQHEIDIIFMDIMMPVMDGINATREIKKFSKNSLIIAVSALDDDYNKKEMLDVGAEDYITKPINSDVFRSRVAHYVTLMQSRAIPNLSNDSVNLYSKNVFNHYHVFRIVNEACLSDFWNYFLHDRVKTHDEMSDVVRALYAGALLLLKMKYSLKIVIEEDPNAIYFTIVTKTPIDEKALRIFESLILKNYEKALFEVNRNIATVVLYKNDHKPLAKVLSQPLLTPVVTADVPAPTPVTSAVKAPVEEVFSVYHFVDNDDLDDLEVYSRELNSMLLPLQNSTLTQEDVLVIAGFIGKIANVLGTYPQTYAISTSLRALSEGIRGHVQSFQQKAAEISPLFSAFSNDITKWLDMLFHSGAPSINFLDDSICTNAQMIIQFIQDDTAGTDVGLDDIFDF